MAAAFMGGMADGINSGISLFNAIENKKHRDRMFEYQEERDGIRDQQWQDTHSLHKAARDHQSRVFEYGKERDGVRDQQWQDTFNQQQGTIDQQQQNWETLRHDEEVSRRLAAFSETMNGRLPELANNPAAQAEFIRQHSGDLQQFINSGYIVGGRDFGRRVKNGYEFDHFTPVTDDKGNPTGEFMAALRNKQTGEIRPMTDNASSDKDDPVSVFSFEDLAHGVSNGGYGNILRARDTFAATVGELYQTGNRDYQQANAQLQAIDEALAKLEDDQPLTEQEEQLVAGLEEYDTSTGASPQLGEEGQPEQGRDPRAPASRLEQGHHRMSAVDDIVGGSYRAVDHTLGGFLYEGLAYPGALALDGARNLGHAVIGARNDNPTKHRDTVGTRRQNIRDSRDEGVEQFRGGLSEAQGQVRDSLDLEAAEPRTPSLSDAAQQQVPAQQVPAQQVREQLQAQRAEVKQSLDVIKQRKDEISGADWRKFAAQHGINLADPESAKQMAMALRHGDANVSDADIRRLQKEQQTMLRQERTEIRQFRSDLLSGLPPSVTGSDYFDRNEWGAAIDLILEDLDPGTFSQMPQSMMRRAMTGAKNSTDVALNLYSMAHSIEPQELRDAVQGYMDSSQQQATPEIVQQIGEHLRTHGHMADFRPR